MTLFRYLYAPAFAFVFLGLAFWLVALAGFSSVWLIPLLMLALATSFGAERALPYEQDWNNAQGDVGSDVLHAAINEALNLLSVAAIPLAAARLPWSGLWPTHWPVGLQMLLAILMADLGITLMHYLSHRVPLLWRLHAVHHSRRRLYGLNGLMKHPLHQALEAVAGTLPLLLLGMPQAIAALLAFAVALQLMLQHSNVDMRLGGLRHIFAWAPVHRFHHLRYGRAGDVNFGLFFTGWDRLLGTAFHRPDYRVDGADLGIGSQPDYPQAYLAQLREPFVPTAPSGPSPRPPAGLSVRSGALSPADGPADGAT
ncbi:sterol desaturase family protein [Pseudomonas sp. RIT-PI-AD]|uniref:sterol desaturase family protein n=1 Tax=Pseudomonas sp. RIT-PI-AD TaxID=3035294 RepID=UPI0021D8E250|nr:sterol desaturase family protein [Pseudomonas sp. RIT-PI-AD]